MPPENEHWSYWLGKDDKKYDFRMYVWNESPPDLPAGVYIFARKEGMDYAGLFINCGKNPDDAIPGSSRYKDEYHVVTQLTDKHCTHVGVHVPSGDDTPDSVLDDIKRHIKPRCGWPVKPQRSRPGTNMKWEG